MICTMHNIQVDNAVCILNQADARYFRAVDSKIKYGYFRKATNVDIVLQNCNRALNNFVKANDTIANRDKVSFFKCRLCSIYSLLMCFIFIDFFSVGRRS